MEPHTLFYAWQNDTPPDCNRYLLRDALKKALVKLQRDETVEECPRLDHDTEGVPGTPSITDTIFEKIKRATIFVGDVTFVGAAGEKRLPNPNVMLELGYALHAISSERVLLLMNTAHGSPEQLPFDLRHRRFPICFHLESGAAKEKKTEVLSDLVGRLAHAISVILKIPEKQQPNRNFQVHISPTRSGKRQLAHLRLFNGGPGPILIDSWWVQWGENGSKGGRQSVSTVKGKLPVRLEDQAVTELLVEIGDELESLSGIGVFDAERHLWLAKEDQLAVFRHNAISHRLPSLPTDPPSQPPLSANDAEIIARVGASTSKRAQLQVLFTNKSGRSFPIQARLAWKYTPPRQQPATKGTLSVAEMEASVSLSPQSRSNPVKPGETVLFVLDDDMTGCLVELLRGDVRDEDIAIEISTPLSGWVATMEEIPNAVKTVAQDVLKRLHG